MMKNSKNLIKISLLIIAVLAFGSLFPQKTYAQNPGYVTGYNTTNYIGVDANGNPYNTSGSGYTYNTGNTYSGGYSNNPAPKIYLVNPNTVNKNLGSVLVAITGDGFVPGAIVKLNGIDQITTYVNSSRLEMHLNDLARMSTGNFIVNVYNPTPGGGFSNSATLNISDSTGTGAGAASTVSTAKKTSTTSLAKAKPKTTTTETNSALTANALFGGFSFIPSTLMGWLMLFIFILILICLWRSLYVTKKDKEKPLKHH